MQVSTTSLVVLLVGTSCILQSTAYVCPYNSTRCECTDDFVQCSGLNFIPPLVPASTEQNFTLLAFVEGNLTSIKKGNLPANLEYIELSDNPITLIADDAFDDSATTLHGLYITGAKLRELPQALLKLTNLSELYVVDTPMEVYHESVLAHIGTKLTILHLINVSLSAWPRWMSYFHVLNTLSFDRTFIRSIPDNAFNSSIDSLQDLSLVSTNLTNVPKALSALVNLTALDLSSNNFANLTVFETFFPSGSKLSTLTIKNAGLTRILNFSNLTSLYTLNLENNNISDPIAGLLSPSVSMLHLANNRLSSVPNLVANMSRLSYLDLSNNNVSRIEPDSLPTSLRDLYLSSNQITEINPGDFPTHLNYLSLSSNKITEINPGDFPSELSNLILSFNQITEIKFEPFPISLGYLDLSHNKIKQINTDNFPSNLSRLDLSFNEINGIVPDNFPTDLYYLDLSHNNLSFISNTTLANLTVLRRLFLNNNPLSIIPVSAFADLKSLTHLYLDYTNLTEIPLALGDLPKNKSLVLVSLEEISSMVCPCPRATKLVKWIEPGIPIVGYCSNGYTIARYFFTPCETTHAGMASQSTTPSGNAPAFGYSLFSIYGALFVCLSLHLYDNSRACSWRSD